MLLFAVLLPTAAPLVLAAPPDQSHADEYAAQLLDEENPQRHVAGLRLKAVSHRQRFPQEVERRLAAYVRQPPTNIETRAELIGEVASVLATSQIQADC